MSPPPSPPPSSVDGSTSGLSSRASSRTPTLSRMSSPFRHAANPVPLLQRIGPPVPDPYAGDAASDDEEEYDDDDDDYEGGVPAQGRRSASLDPIKREDDFEIRDEDAADAAPFSPWSVNSPTPQPMPPPGAALPFPPPPAAPTAVHDGEPVAALNASLQLRATVTAPASIVSTAVVASTLAIAAAVASALISWAT